MLRREDHNQEQILSAGGAPIARHLAEDHGLTITNVVVFIVGAEGIWLQRRSPHKRDFPGLWDVSACGAIRAHESVLQAARRELLEEIGIECELKHVTSFSNDFTDSAGAVYRRLSHLFVGASNTPARAGDEVSQLSAVPLEVLLKRLEAAPMEFVPPFAVELERARDALQLLIASRSAG
jgi:isopentenyl-diphosphate delta-isomerase